jgi:hypothetical protein
MAGIPIDDPFGKVIFIDLAEINVGDLPVDQHIDGARQVKRDPERASKAVGGAKRQHAKYDLGVGKMIDHGTDGAVPTAKNDELASFGNFLPYYLMQPLRVPNGIGRIEGDSRLCEQPLGFRIGVRTVSRTRVHDENRMTASFDLLFQRNLFRATIGRR